MADNKYIIFKLADESYGVPIGAVERILPEQQVTRLPRTPKLFLGVFDLRGETVPTIDLRIRFDFTETTQTCNFIVVLTQTGRCALKVDEVDGIVNIDEAEIEESPEIMRRKEDAFIAGVGKSEGKLVVLLDVDHLVPEAVAKQAAKLAVAA